MSNYQVIFNGITIGSGTNYVIQNIDGLGGTAPLRVQDDNRGYIDGSYSGRDFYDARTVTIDMLVLGDGSHTAQYYYKQLQIAFAPQQLGYYKNPVLGTNPENYLQLFQFQLNADTGLKRMYGRSRGLTTPINPEFTYGYIVCRLEVYFPDSRYYDDAGTTGTGSTITVSNSGWAYSSPVISIASPSASGSITDGITTMTFASVPTGSALTVDLLQRVIYTGSTPARNIMTSASNGWLAIPPYYGSPVSWVSSVGSMSITYRNAYV